MPLREAFLRCPSIHMIGAPYKLNKILMNHQRFIGANLFPDRLIETPGQQKAFFIAAT